MPANRDMYDHLPADRGAELRRRNLERLAELDAQGSERRARLARALGDPSSPEDPGRFGARWRLG
jgi:hypothetical protein